MKYVFALKEGYHVTEFVFRDYVQGCSFMSDALDHIKTDEESVKFTVYVMKEGAEDGE